MKRYVSLIILIFLGGAISVYFNHQLNEKEKEIQVLQTQLSLKWDEELGQHQFLSNHTFKYKPAWQAFADSMDLAYEILRKALINDSFPKSEQDYLRVFIFDVFAPKLKVRSSDISQRLAVEPFEDIFSLSTFEAVETLSIVINPYFMSGRGYFADYDFWPIFDTPEFSSGDTVRYMIRLLKNHKLQNNQLKFITSQELRIIENSLGEITHIIPKDTPSNDYYPIPFRLYNWLLNDTLEEEIIIAVQ